MAKRASKPIEEEPECRSGYEQVISMIRSLEPYQQPLARKVITNRLQKLSSRDWQQLFQGQRVDFPYDEMEGIVSAFYEELVDTYVGVDSNLPSEFITKIHPYLLRSLPPTSNDVQGVIESKYCYGRRLVRILAVGLSELQADLDSNGRDFQDYISYHTTASGDDRIALLQVSPEYAKRAYVYHKLKTTDVGLWIRNCALLFQAGISKEKKIELQLVCAKAKDVEQQNFFRSCVAYVIDIVSNAKRLVLDKSLILEDLDEEFKEDLIWSLDELVQPALAEAWPMLVNADHRMNQREGNALKQYVLSEYERPAILDAAAGVGAESVWLKTEGYDNVTSNEIVWEFVERARQHASDKGVSLKLWSYDWRHLRHKVPECEFDVVLALGNSLTCLMTPQEMKRCISGFHHILKPGGRLVVDSRDYQYMIDHIDEMRRRNYRFRHDVVYPSDAIKAKPTSITGVSAPLCLEYYDDDDRRVGMWRVYAYREGELEGLLEEDGLFEIERKLWDFLDEPSREEPPEFITYIARVKK